MDGRVLKRSDPSTIQDKFLVGYQGWFTCAGDGEPIDPGHHGWLHWYNHPIADGGRPMIDPWPDVSEYTPSELYQAPGIKFPNGEPATLFSSRHPKTVQRHFNWMARHSIDGVFLQRFLGVCDPEHQSKGIRRLRDEIGDRVREAAEKEGRVFALMYDVSGVKPERVMSILTRDWSHLIHDQGILDSPNYLKEKGKPVIALWGFGFHGRNHTPELVREVTRFIRDVTPGGAYLMAGTPTHWRRAVEDADRNPAFLDVWLNEFDGLSPWLVGRLRDEEAVDKFAEQFMKADIDLLKKNHEEGKRKIDYIPVVYPGFSGLNLSQGEWGFNQIKRNGGRLLWQQIFNAKRLGLRTMYGAMWDEYDEGTALMPVVEKTRLLPRAEKFSFLALDADGYDLPADWYMRICGFAAEGLRSERMIHETFPSKELQDYWSTRPRYEQVKAISESSGSGTRSDDGDDGEGSRSYNDWLATQKDGKDEPPPPPYSLQAEEPAASTSSASHAQVGDPQLQQSPHNQQMSAAVVSLASTFSRQSISSPSAASDTASSASSSNTRPPLHPSHPSRTSSGSSGTGSSSSISRPPAHPSRPHPPEPNFLSRPHSVSVSQPHTQTPTQSQPLASTSSPQWPPAEWNAAAGPSRPSSVPYQAYQPGRPLAHGSLRPTTTPPRPTGAPDPMASSFHEQPARPQSHTSLRPAVSSSRPETPYNSQSGPQTSPLPHGAPSMPFLQDHAPNAPNFSPPGPSSPPLGSPSFPPGPYGPAAVHNSPSVPSTYHSSYSPPPGNPSFPSGPYSPTTVPSPEVPYAARPSHPSQPYAGSSYPGMSPPHSPVAQGRYPDQYYGSSLHHVDGAYPPPPMQPYQMPGHPPAPSPYPHEAPGPWAPHPPTQTHPSYSPSPVPPNQYQAPYANYSYPQQMPQTSSTSSSLTRYARNAVDKVAGQDTRQQFENTLGSLAHSGSKLLGKFTK
ncbi:hypothetical protein GYMLUDRAFT_223561 [Collybiopsis luxurians FD-317 M1]|uniref:Xylosidase/arabinosidase n=1 Tax=Collybiopsis luxurians FD-317 M1 TaxID=944289 RepID=A0A0D0D0A9_9AGAR|nr:hypothetical protein GYMLUDRAFT_223561 [Collybiopsis luxurians FD-317 M1]